jgi:hypothetical protein
MIARIPSTSAGWRTASDGLDELEELGGVHDRVRPARLADQLLLRDLRAEVANDGEFDTSTTTAAPSSTSASPFPVRVFTPVFGVAATAS